MHPARIVLEDLTLGHIRRLQGRRRIASSRQVTARLGVYAADCAHTMKESRWVQLFMAPGVYHCEGGPGPDLFDDLPVLEAWVGRGDAPEE